MRDMSDQITAEVMAQPEAARLGYALDLVRYFLDPVPEYALAARRFRLVGSDRDLRLLHALDRRRASWLTKDGARAALALDLADDPVSDEAVRQRIALLRRRLARSGLGLAVENVRGLGYRLKAPAGFDLVQLAGARHA